ncbi:MAG: response regulator transcription factor [Verrucomicrobia bacterium]|nr:MAG: response regulator transcription factor [Verrucomicrobiota bacterium]
MIKVAIVEDDARIRRMLSEVLAAAKNCQCIGAFSNGTTAVAKLPALAPDVILMDINLPDTNGVDCVVQLAPQLPNTQIIMLTIYQNPEMIFQALAAGAHGYLVKPVMPAKLLEAIREIHAGGAPMSPNIAREVISFFQHDPPSPKTGTTSEEVGLGPREQQVLKFLMDGLTYKEIASELDIGLWTVATYVRRIYEKLHVRNRRGIIAHYKVDGNKK